MSLHSMQVKNPIAEYKIMNSLAALRHDALPEKYTFETLQESGCFSTTICPFIKGVNEKEYMDAIKKLKKEFQKKNKQMMLTGFTVSIFDEAENCLMQKNSHYTHAKPSEAKKILYASLKSDLQSVNELLHQKIELAEKNKIPLSAAKTFVVARYLTFEPKNK